MRKKLLFTAGAALVMTLGSGSAAFADGLVTTPTQQVGSTGQPCVFVGGSTVGNPLVGQPIFKGDPKTGVYTNCPV